MDLPLRRRQETDAHGRALWPVMRHWNGASDVKPCSQPLRHGQLTMADRRSRFTDGVSREEKAEVDGLLLERIGRSSTLAAVSSETTVHGRMLISAVGWKSNPFSGEDSIMPCGALTDTWTGMEERPGTAAADGVMVDLAGTLFEREYGSSRRALRKSATASAAMRSFMTLARVWSRTGSRAEGAPTRGRGPRVRRPGDWQGVFSCSRSQSRRRLKGGRA